MSLLSLLPVIIILSGIYFLIKLRCFFIKHPIRTLKFAFSGTNKKKSILSLILALAGTLGVGNISGVAIGIATGGAGSVFWLIISALFSSAIKYAEVYVSYREGGSGMIYVIKRSLVGGSFFAYIYAYLAVILSVSMGSMFQARAIAEASKSFSDKGFIFCAIILLAFLVFVCLLGKDKIKGAVAIIIPIAMIIYTGMCFYVIFANLQRLPAVISNIVHSAFSFKSAAGGILGFTVCSGMKEGFARGLLSNEAGAGTSSFSHTSHLLETPNEKECKRAGIFGILEVVFDTLLLCPLTAFAILLGNEEEDFSGSLSELSFIFETDIGPFAAHLLLYCIVFFAISTTLCWYYYGRVALRFICGTRFSVFFSFAFFTSFFVSVLRNVPHVLFITDTALFLMSVISLSALIKNRAHLVWDENTLG